jgi:L-rhamnose mutarotase
MERLCYTFDLTPGMEEEYERRHNEAWPELLEALKDSGFSNYSLFRRGLEVIAYVECEPSFEQAMARLARTEVSGRWNVYIRSLMTRSVDPDGRFFTVREIWHLD